MVSLSGLRMRYLIGADNPGEGKTRCITVCPYEYERAPVYGVAGAYINLFDQTGTGKFFPYLEDTDTADQYNERVPDPLGLGFWNLLRRQCTVARNSGFKICGDVDNRDAYSNDIVLKVYDNIRDVYGMDIICKNPGMSDEGEDSTVLLAHDRVIGAIIERGDITPRRIHDMRVAAKKPTLPIFFVSFGSGRVWAERTANAIKADSYQEMSVSYSAEGEYESSETILAPITT